MRRDSLGRQLQGRRGFLPTPAGALTAPRIDQAPGSDGHEPRSRVVGSTRFWPLERGREQGVLHGVLASVELPMPPHQGGEDLGRQLAQQVPDLGARTQNSGGAPITRRPSMGAFPNATTPAPISIPPPSLSPSTLQQPT